MKFEDNQPLWDLMGALFTAHPWHGVSIGDGAPEKVTAFIESVPTDTVKYEIDKISGHLMIDRPQKYSNVCPTLYGLVPQTYCAKRVAKLCSDSLGRTGVVGDRDPVDICVLTEKDISHGNILVSAIPIGGLRMLDGSEADDKLVAVLEKDAAYGHMRDISEVPPAIIDRLQHYFETYKQGPSESVECEIAEIYGREQAYDVIRASRKDYNERFAGLYDNLNSALRGHR